MSNLSLTTFTLTPAMSKCDCVASERAQWIVRRFRASAERFALSRGQRLRQRRSGMVAFVVVEGSGAVTFASGDYPVQKPMPGGGPRRAHSVKLAIKSRMEVLAGVPLFAGLSKRQLQEIARGCASRRWPSDCIVVPEGTKAEVCYIIVEGTVDVRRHGRTIAQLGPGEFFGEIGLLDPGPRSATVTTTTEMTSVELTRRNFLAVAGDKPAILLRMLEALAKRLRETTATLSY